MLPRDGGCPPVRLHRTAARNALMPTTFVSAEQIVSELGLYTSIHAVHRAAKRGEIPHGRLYGRRHLWDREALLVHEPPPKKRRKVIVR